jgi:hypothetical protein
LLGELTYDGGILGDYFLPTVGAFRIVEIYGAGVLNAQTVTDQAISSIDLGYIIDLSCCLIFPFCQGSRVD